MIAEGVLAVEMGANATDLKLSIHAHPTLTETMMESAEVFFGQATHVYRPKRKRSGPRFQDRNGSCHRPAHRCSGRQTCSRLTALRAGGHPAGATREALKPRPASCLRDNASGGRDYARAAW